MVGLLREHPEINEVIQGGDPLMHKDNYWLSYWRTSATFPDSLCAHSHPLASSDSGAAHGSVDRVAGASPGGVGAAQQPCASGQMRCCNNGCKSCVNRVLCFNQAVMLAGINDSVAAQVALCQVLDECGVLPYYVHCLDPVQGAAHFAVPRATARHIHQQVKASPGYLVPRLVAEEVGANAKVWVNSEA